ncbi:MAG: UbiA family prenyltransferase [Candidatus Anstonellaceae archaeon]
MGWFSDAKLLVQVSRPAGWAIGPLVFFFSLQYVKAAITPLAIVQAILLSFPYNLFLLGFNDIYDYESDRINKRKNSAFGPVLLPANRRIVRKAALACAALLAMSSLATASAFNISAMFLLLIFSYFYSVPPVRLKERPPFDSISNGLAVFLVGCLGVSFGGSFSDIPLKAYFASLCVVGVHAFSTIMDFSPDKKTGQKTFSTVFGKRAAAAFAFLTVASTAAFAGIRSPAINAYLVFCSALFLIAVARPDEQLASRIFKAIFAGFLLAAIASVLFGTS